MKVTKTPKSQRKDFEFILRSLKVNWYGKCRELEIRIDHNPTRKRGIDPSLTRRVVMDANLVACNLALT